ncbi:hypothetical protein WME89_47790 [Sorangium sp. So ce321]|uniref:hypothetical protein n=1 Tax=Sorangium sp. So ce321 TaxID=3133300 RepID=UPI003F61FBDE
MSILGLRRKLADARSEEKIVSALSEVRVAVAFAQRGHSVELLPDDARPEWPTSPPDLVLYHRDYRAYVEVFRWSPDDTGSQLHERLAPVLEERDLVLRMSLPEGLSSLVVRHDERTERERLIEAIADEIIALVQELDPSNLPFQTTIRGAQIDLMRSEPGRGRLGSWNTAATFIPNESYDNQLVARLVKKAAKPSCWPETKQHHPYFVAVDAQQTLGQYDAFARVLYGPSTFNPWMGPDERRSPAVRYPEIVEERLKTPWRDLLLSLGYDATKRHYIREPGFFAREPPPSDLCGVITLHQDVLEFFPNPFADARKLRHDYHQELGIGLATAIEKRVGENTAL